MLMLATVTDGMLHLSISIPVPIIMLILTVLKNNSRN